MKVINISIRRQQKDEAESFNVLLSELPDNYGLYTYKIVDDTLTEIFSVTKSSLSECENDLLITINSLGCVINVYEIRKDEETIRIIDRIRDFNKGIN